MGVGGILKWEQFVLTKLITIAFIIIFGVVFILKISFYQLSSLLKQIDSNRRKLSVNVSYGLILTERTCFCLCTHSLLVHCTLYAVILNGLSFFFSLPHSLFSSFPLSPSFVLIATWYYYSPFHYFIFS